MDINEFIFKLTNKLIENEFYGVEISNYSCIRTKTK